MPVSGGVATMGRALNAHKIWGRSYTFVWFRLWNGLARERGLFVALDRGRCGVSITFHCSGWNINMMSILKSRQRLLTGTLCHTSQQPPSLGGYNPSYKTRSLKTRGLQYVT